MARIRYPLLEIMIIAIADRHDRISGLQMLRPENRVLTIVLMSACVTTLLSLVPLLITVGYQSFLTDQVLSGSDVTVALGQGAIKVRKDWYPTASTLTQQSYRRFRMLQSRGFVPVDDEEWTIKCDAWAKPHHWVPRISLPRIVEGVNSSPDEFFVGYPITTEVVMPLWIVPICSGLVAIVTALRLRRPYLRSACRTCGYDCRTNSDGVCPECGTPIPAAQSAAIVATTKSSPPTG